MRCRYCQHEEPSHAKGCPKHVSYQAEADRVLYAWQRGYNHGRSGSDAKEEDPSYHLGWLEGVRALEEASNGSDSW